MKKGWEAERGGWRERGRADFDQPVLAVKVIRRLDTRSSSHNLQSSSLFIPDARK